MINKIYKFIDIVLWGILTGEALLSNEGQAPIKLKNKGYENE
jgi:hypothetical protein